MTMTEEGLPMSEEQVQLTEEQERIRNLFLRNAVNAGAKVQMPNGVIIAPRKRVDPQASTSNASPVNYDAQDDREVIDLDIENVDEKTIYLRWKEDGKLVEYALLIPAPHMDVAFMAGRYQFQIEQKYRAMQRTKSKQEAQRLDAELLNLNTELVGLLVPTLTPEILSRLNLRALTEIVNIAQGMVQAAASSQATVQSVVRRYYRLVGRPFGDTEKGMVRWIQEQLRDIDENYTEEGDDPNV
jgi:hypothetical protein